ncbi:Glutaredoxin-dependent peroxiredoxin [Psidium guajava]|nr:Glutaredoxin-dependent peroxiredoxin [Psidium guajava]
MAVSGEPQPLDGSPPHELTSKTPFPSLELYILIGILSLSVLSIALSHTPLLPYQPTSKKHNKLAKEMNSRASIGPSYDPGSCL